ncbi:MAG: ankyrin repeat domain-containing protein [Acidilobus sp.]
MGADVEALVEAIRRGDAAKALALLKSVDPSSRDGLGNTPLHWAAAYGPEELVKSLLDMRVDPNVRNSSGVTPLHWAAERGHAEVVWLLLQRGTDPNAKDNCGLTPLDRTAAGGS